MVVTLPFRYECLSNDIVLPSSGIVDRLLPAKIADNRLDCFLSRGIFVVQYLNDFGGDFIISIDGNENLRVSGEDSRVTKLYFPTQRNCVDDCECEDWEQEGAVLVGL